MLGAIIGDIVGSRWEFNNYHNKYMPFMTDKNFITDDTVMTCAVADALINENNKKITEILQKYGRNFPNMSYGRKFAEWLESEDPQPYNSWGNGAAMRISPVGWYAKDEKELKKLSKKITSVSHNHPEAIKGAETVAMCIFKARHGATKTEIKKYVISQYPEIATMDYHWLNHNYRFDESCQGSVPQAIFCFLISSGFEDCIRTTVSIGGDSDTLSAISGSIAEAFYGIPLDIKLKALDYFISTKKRELLRPIAKIYDMCGKTNYIKL